MKADERNLASIPFPTRFHRSEKTSRLGSLLWGKRKSSECPASPAGDTAKETHLSSVAPKDLKLKLHAGGKEFRKETDKNFRGY